MINIFSRMLLISVYQDWNFRHSPSSVECLYSRQQKTRREMCVRMNVEMENEEKRRILSVFDFTRRRMNLFPFSPNNNREIVRYSGLHISFAIDIYLYAIWWRSNSIFTAHTKRLLYPHKNHAINLCKCGDFCVLIACTQCPNNIANSVQLNHIYSVVLCYPVRPDCFSSFLPFSIWIEHI